MTLIVKCPVCHTDVAWTSQSLFRPFCSERCRLIDLSDWADEKRAVVINPELFDNLHDQE